MGKEKPNVNELWRYGVLLDVARGISLVSATTRQIRSRVPNVVSYICMRTAEHNKSEGPGIALKQIKLFAVSYFARSLLFELFAAIPAFPTPIH